MNASECDSPVFVHGNIYRKSNKTFYKDKHGLLFNYY